MKAFHLGWYLNRYALWFCVEHFANPADLVRWLKLNAHKIDGVIEFISYADMD